MRGKYGATETHGHLRFVRDQGKKLGGKQIKKCSRTVAGSTGLSAVATVATPFRLLCAEGRRKKQTPSAGGVV